MSLHAENSVIRMLKKDRTAPESRDSKCTLEATGTWPLSYHTNLLAFAQQSA